LRSIEVAPPIEGGRAGLLEEISAIEVTIKIEVIVD